MSSSPRTYSPSLPLALILAAALLWSGFQWVQLKAESANISGMITGLQPQYEQSQKLRAQLDAISAGMKKLADKGNQNAALVVEDLRKRGITISAPK